MYDSNVLLKARLELINKGRKELIIVTSFSWIIPICIALHMI